MDSNLDLSKLQDLANATLPIRETFPGRKALAVPEGYSVEQFSDADFLSPVARVARTLESPAAFAAYVNRFAKTQTSVFFDIPNRSATAIIDYHGPEKTDYCKHLITFKPRFSQSWTRWKAGAGEKQGQGAFLRFLEENRFEVVEPDAATLLEMVGNFESVRDFSVKSQKRLQDGSVQFQLINQERQSDGVSSARLPQTLALALPIFFQGPIEKIAVFLRYRVEDGRLVLFYELDRAQEAEDSAFGQLVVEINDALDTGVHRYGHE